MKTYYQSYPKKFEKKKMKGLFGIIFSRFGATAFIILIQVAAIFTLINIDDTVATIVYASMHVVNIGTILYIVNERRMDPTSKIVWAIVVMIFPVFGFLFFVLAESHLGSRKLFRTVRYEEQKSRHLFGHNETALHHLEQSDTNVAGIAKFLQKTAGYPVYENSQISYFPLGEYMWMAMLRELNEAKQFIFMEYFIVEQGKMWDSILSVLAKKAQEGVSVYVMYDGTCEISKLHHDYKNYLQSLGIHCKVFSPLHPVISTQFNYRDHRKIAVIDGHTAFTGGVNLADEYMNYIEIFGHWKDTAIMVKGDAVRSYSILFLQMWSSDERDFNWNPFLKKSPSTEHDGFILPYANCPLSKENKLAEQVYMALLNNAQQYLYIMTPYLILDGKLCTTMKYAALRGVDVRLILPGIPDKKLPYALAKSHYAELLEAGVKIYEYTPGFVHAKMFLADDQTAVVGTINLDYRSLYHHFECGTLLHRCEAIQDIKKDFLHTFEKCQRVSVETVHHEKRKTKIIAFIGKLIAPLL